MPTAGSPASSRRGGSFLASWMARTGEENPLLKEYDRLLDIGIRARSDAVAGRRHPAGATGDATDAAQIQELLHPGRADAPGARTIGAGDDRRTGHVPIDQVEANVLLQKRVCRGAPFYVLGPLNQRHRGGLRSHHRGHRRKRRGGGRRGRPVLRDPGRAPAAACDPGRARRRPRHADRRALR